MYKKNNNNIFNNNNQNFEDCFELSSKKTLRYLGDQIGSTKLGINHRISKANQAFGRLYHNLWNRNNVSFRIKLKSRQETR